MLLEPGEHWTDDFNQSVTTSKASTVTIDPISDSEIMSDIIPESPILGEEVQTLMVDGNMEYMWQTFEIPWNKLPMGTLLACEKGLKQRDIHTQVIHMVANEMRSIKTSPSSKAARIVAQKMISKYPLAFQDIDDDGVVLGDGSISVFMKLYERLSYLNRPHKRSSSEPTTSKKKMKHAVAGCQSGWNPEITTFKDEELTVLKENLNNFKNNDSLNNQMEFLLEKTFSLQREFLNNVEKSPTVVDILREWPILFNKSVIVWHFNKITNVDLNTFLVNLEQKHGKIMKFDKNGESARMTDDKYLQVLSVIFRYFKEDISKVYSAIQVSIPNKILYKLS